MDHPLRGRDGEALATDVARFGAPDARRALVMTSATHGVEGLCGSGIQCALLAAGDVARLAGDVAVVLVHAHNPHGFSWLRRTTEENVDLNRNGRAFDLPIEPNRAYAEVHDLLLPDDWEGPAWRAAQTQIEAYIAERGERAWQAAVSGGQHTHADGLFYGGVAPTWSHGTIRRIAREQLATFEHVGVLDLHTGLGPRGYGELIYALEPSGEEYRRLVDWLGPDLTSVLDGSSASAPVAGTIDALYREELGAEQVSFAVIEYGTLPIDQVLEALRFDNWVHVRDQVDTDLGRAAKRRMVEAFVGEEEAWRASVYTRALECAEGMASGLARL